MLIALALSVLAISPSFESGAVVKSIAKNSPLFEQGLRQGDIIKEINGMPIESAADYTAATNKIFIGGDVRIDVVTKDSRFVAFVNETPDMIVQDIPRTKIKTGLDIQGGARALVEPEQAITNDQLQDLIAISNNRFNVFGLSDVKIRGVTDLSGNRFMLIEVAGATPTDLQELISQQGKFEARIGSQTVFSGGSEDITSVCRNDASCAGITGCSQIQGGGYGCNFRFTIYLSEEAARRHADITNGIDIDMTSGGQYLKGNLSLLLDNQVVDELLISRDLKGQVTTQISIQGSGQGATQEDALNEARASMHQLQTVLITGSLPYKLSIVKLDTIAPLLGGNFVYTLLIAGSVAILAVGLVILLRYRNIKESLAVLFTAFAEIVIILGVASLIGWNLDLPSIAGILATIGTGVNQQIIILDEARRSKDLALKARMKRALFVVFSAYATALVSLLPLYWASAGLFKGFAVTTIIGITAGVLISRPAFAAMIEKIEN